MWAARANRMSAADETDPSFAISGCTRSGAGGFLARGERESYEAQRQLHRLEDSHAHIGTSLPTTDFLDSVAYVFLRSP